MKLEPIIWNTLDVAAQRQALERAVLAEDDSVRHAVARVIAQVRADGDATLRALTRRFDGCELAELAVSPAEFEAAEAEVGAELKQAMISAAGRIAAFHRAGAPQPYALDTAEGVRCERLLRPLDRVGLYVPAGSAPLPSTALMLCVPAQIAGCPEAVLCSPPTPEGRVDAAVLVAARLCGVSRVFKLGGAQAIAAMAFGSESVPACDKLFGPGNAYVTEAKKQVSAMMGGPAIDMPAGPSEVLVIADDAADPVFLAADLLSQAEHGPDSQAILLTDSEAQARRVADEMDRQAAELPRSEIVGRSMQHARLIVMPDLAAAFEVSNRYAPEHLIVNVADARSWLPKVRAAGSVFLGPWSPEALGDYCSGTNHVLPTYGAARAYSGVSVQSFLRQITVQEVSPAGLRAIGNDAAVMARAERLVAHERAVTLRLSRLGDAA
ncbi:histidinol dehydrogenase [Pseudomarimonas salicorniae]|uniref:Histidinol dehydrogenase n=1 Tax=Pseudomarimonas salicorniae TaxID=2933270 RepID=A0ABT0GLH4_9GAMM|nr:histidinol dehydrogenase [Lysobacter sp. CAU 1642]MCK7595400.1 histidinol dehydrogenase [Lysobacter sp. CAU 1642]